MYNQCQGVFKILKGMIMISEGLLMCSEHISKFNNLLSIIQYSKSTIKNQNPDENLVQIPETILNEIVTNSHNVLQELIKNNSILSDLLRETNTTETLKNRLDSAEIQLKEILKSI